MFDENNVLAVSAAQFQSFRLQNERQFLEMRRGAYFYSCIHVTFGSIELAALRTYLSVLVHNHLTTPSSKENNNFKRNIFTTKSAKQGKLAALLQIPSTLTLTDRHYFDIYRDFAERF
ncbi:hypothetical protein PGB90_008107 [Kerria lacca]